MDDQPIAIDVRNAEIDGVLQDIIDRVHGLKAVLISTNDGVPLVQVSTQAGDSQEEAAVAEATAPEHLAYLQTELATTFAAAAKQIVSMKLGAVKSLISEYSRFLLVHLNGVHLVITLVATKDANVALMLSLAPQLKKALSLLSEQIAY